MSISLLFNLTGLNKHSNLILLDQRLFTNLSHTAIATMSILITSPNSFPLPHNSLLSASAIFGHPSLFPPLFSPIHPLIICLPVTMQPHPIPNFPLSLYESPFNSISFQFSSLPFLPSTLCCISFQTLLLNLLPLKLTAVPSLSSSFFVHLTTPCASL